MPLEMRGIRQAKKRERNFPSRQKKEAEGNVVCEKAQETAYGTVPFGVLFGPQYVRCSFGHAFWRLIPHIGDRLTRRSTRRTGNKSRSLCGAVPPAWCPQTVRPRSRAEVLIVAIDRGPYCRHRSRYLSNLVWTMSNNSDNPAKNKTVSIEELLTQHRWVEIRKRLKRIASPTRIGELLYFAADRPGIPDDIFETLFEKLKGKRERTHPPPVAPRPAPRRSRRPGPSGAEAGGGYDVDSSLWAGVCNYHRERGYGKRLRDVCLARSVSSLRIFMKEYLDIFGMLSVDGSKNSGDDVRKILCYLWTSYFTDGDLVREEKENEFLGVSSWEDLERIERLHTLWQKTELLMMCTKNDTIDESARDCAFVHLLIKGRLPRVVVWMALTLYPEQAKLRDDKGRLPIHLAASLNNRNSEEHFALVFQGGMQKIKEKRMVEVVLDFFPAGAKVADRKGSLPLALLLKLEYDSFTNNSWTRRCIVALIKQAPEALTRRYAGDGLLPFMTAASMHDKHTVTARTKSEEQSMLLRKQNLCYTVLRSNPTVVASGITDTARERYLEKKLQEAEDEIHRLRARVAMLEAGESSASPSTKKRRCE